MLHQANRQSQPAHTGKPGACVSCIGASALNRLSNPSRDRYQGHSHGDSHTVTRTAQPGAKQSASEQVPGMGNQYVPMSRARINGHVLQLRALNERKPGRDPGAAHNITRPKRRGLHNSLIVKSMTNSQQNLTEWCLCAVRVIICMESDSYEGAHTL